MRNKAREEYLGFSVRKQKHNILGTNVENPLRKRQLGVLFATNATRNAFLNGHLPEVKERGNAEALLRHPVTYTEKYVLNEVCVNCIKTLVLMYLIISRNSLLWHTKTNPISVAAAKSSYKELSFVIFQVFISFRYIYLNVPTTTLRNVLT
jgi:hypothetical protein